MPTTNRWLMYELEQLGLVSKKPAAPDDPAEPRLNRHGNKIRERLPSQNLTDAVTHLRKVGLIPYSWVHDEGRHASSWRSAPSVAAFVAESVPRARIDLWRGVLRPVLICESRGVAGVLERGVCADYLVTTAGTGGQCTGFLVNQVAPLLAGEETRVLYLGDFYDCGAQIEAHTRGVLERETGRTFGEETWERVALTAEQVEVLRRRGVEPILKKDDRYNDQNPHEAFECEALGQGPLVALLRARLDELLPEPLEDVLEREERQRRAVRRMLAGKKKPRRRP